MSRVSQDIARYIGQIENYIVHTGLRVEDRLRMNQTIWETLIKLALETGMDWVTLLPFALYRVRNSLY